eukprot:scaffold49_cov409-Prasinococcus_capsulatus_cf.AAC.17
MGWSKSAIPGRSPRLAWSSPASTPRRPEICAECRAMQAAVTPTGTRRRDILPTLLNSTAGPTPAPARAPCERRANRRAAVPPAPSSGTGGPSLRAARLAAEGEREEREGWPPGSDPASMSKWRSERVRLGWRGQASSQRVRARAAVGPIDDDGRGRSRAVRPSSGRGAMPGGSMHSPRLG